MTSQMRALPFSPSAFFSRHAVERIVFLFPVIAASFAFRQRGGWTVLILVVLLMLPRATWLSPSPADAIVETAATAATGSLIVWLIERQAREKELRQEAVSRLSAVHEVIAIATRSLDLDQTLNATLDKVLAVMDADAGLIFTLDRPSQALVLFAHRGVSEEAAAEISRVGLDEGPYSHVARSGEPTLVRDPAHGEPALLGEGLRSQVVVPLQSRDSVQGVLAVACHRLRTCQPEDLALLTAIGKEIGAAVENAQLHRDVAWQLQTQQRLREVAEEITSELELDKILRQVLQIAEELVGAEAGGIALFGPDRASIHYPYLHNLPQELADVIIPTGHGAAGEVMSTGYPAIVEDYQTYPDAIPAFAEAGLISLVAVPIVSGDNSFGALTVASITKTKHFSDTDVAILTGIGRQAGIAIENARLYRRMQFYAREITRAQEDERQRIARELHDETIQMLIVLSRRLEASISSSRSLPETTQQQLGRVQALIGDILAGTRRLVRDLRPPALDHLGLVAAIRGLARDLTEGHGIQAQVVVEGEMRRLAPEVELTLFRIIQEALNNVRRHSGASRVITRLVFRADSVRAIIDDDGRGFDAPEEIGDLVSTGKLGLIGMYERARTLGGTLSLQSKPHHGAVVTVDVPLLPL
jgi:signal transduction histidine kinase